MRHQHWYAEASSVPQFPIFIVTVLFLQALLPNRPMLSAFLFLLSLFTVIFWAYTISFADMPSTETRRSQWMRFWLYLALFLPIPIISVLLPGLPQNWPELWDQLLFGSLLQLGLQGGFWAVCFAVGIVRLYIRETAAQKVHEKSK